MSVITVWRHGMSLGNPPSSNSHRRAKRDTCQGWSNSSTRSNTRFLYSVDEQKLDRYGLALTLTLRYCPATHDEWKRLRTAFFKRLRRLGLVRAHWITEWQRRGVPHLHMAVWFDSSVLFPGTINMPALNAWCSPVPARIITGITEAWLAVAAVHGAQWKGQHIKPISDSVGWFQYLSKHASRGLRHYQRSPENIPASWKEKTGRMWGMLGDWPVSAAVKLYVDMAGFWAYRRIVQRWRLASARLSDDPFRIRSARRMLRSTDPKMSAVRGVSEWIGQDMNMAILKHLAGRGFTVTC